MKINVLFFLIISSTYSQVATANLMCSEIFYSTRLSGQDLFASEVRDYLSKTAEEIIREEESKQTHESWVVDRKRKDDLRSTVSDSVLQEINAMTGFLTEPTNNKFLETGIVPKSLVESLNALKALPGFSGVVYRGHGGIKKYMSYENGRELIKNLLSKVGHKFLVPNIWSSSKDIGTALSFTEVHRGSTKPDDRLVLIKLHVTSAKDISDLARRQEKEVIVLPGTRFEILSTQEGVTVIDKHFSYGSFSRTPEERKFTLVELREIPKED